MRARRLISPAGYEQCCRELAQLRDRARGELAERLRLARQDGDLDANPVLHDLLEEQVQLERRISRLEGELAEAEIVAPAVDGHAGIGSRVRVQIGTDVFEYQLAGPLEADAQAGRLSIAAPVGAALLGQRAGEHVEVATPRGALVLHVLAVQADRFREAA